MISFQYIHWSSHKYACRSDIFLCDEQASPSLQNQIIFYIVIGCIEVSKSYTMSSGINEEVIKNLEIFYLIIKAYPSWVGVMDWAIFYIWLIWWSSI